jgi:hypothetical protein
MRGRGPWRGLRAAHLARAAGIVPLGVVLATGSGVSVPVLLAFAVASSGPAGVAQTLAGIRVAEIRPETERAAANGLRAAGQNAAFGFAPIVVAVGVGPTGYPAAALAVLVGVVATAAVLGSLPVAAPPVPEPSAPERSAGALRVLRNPFILVLLLQGTILVLAARGPGKVLGLIHLHDIGAYRLLALVGLAQFAGAVAGSLLATRLSAGLTTGAAAACFAGCALPLTALAARAPGAVLLAAFVAAGLAYAVYLVCLATSVQNGTDAAGLGAVYSAQGLIWWSADPVGLFVVGQAAGIFDVRTVALGALAFLALSGGVVVPLLHRYRPAADRRAGGGPTCTSR